MNLVLSFIYSCFSYSGDCANVEINRRFQKSKPSNLEIHPYVHLHLLINRSINLHPILLQWRESVGRDRYLAKLDLSVRHLVRFQRLE